jgi:DNA-binding GntR family transcriptional regulator
VGDTPAAAAVAPRVIGASASSPTYLGVPAADTRTLTTRVADLIRGAIVSGALPAGQALRQEELAARFGISRIPLREALRQLEVEGLILSAPYRGAVVAPLSAAEIREITALRLNLERVALELAVPRLTDTVLDALAGSADELGRNPDFARQVQLHEDFFLRLYGAAEAPLLLSVVRLVLGRGLRYLPPQAGDGDGGLAPLVAALRDRNASAAWALLAARLEADRDDALRRLS